MIPLILFRFAPNVLRLQSGNFHVVTITRRRVTNNYLLQAKMTLPLGLHWPKKTQAYLRRLSTVLILT